MRKVKGYVFLAVSSGKHRLFGRRVSRQLPYNFENLQTNGIVPYDDFREAVIEAHQYAKVISNTTKTNVGELEMQIAESEKDFKNFVKKGNIIVIENQDFHQDFLVRGTERGLWWKMGQEAPYGSDFGLQFYNVAKHLINTTNKKQAGKATIATFNLSLLD